MLERGGIPKPSGYQFAILSKSSLGPTGLGYRNHNIRTCNCRPRSPACALHSARVAVLSADGNEAIRQGMQCVVPSPQSCQSYDKRVMLRTCNLPLRMSACLIMCRPRWRHLAVKLPQPHASSSEVTEIIFTDVVRARSCPHYTSAKASLLSLSKLS